MQRGYSKEKKKKLSYLGVTAEMVRVIERGRDRDEEEDGEEEYI